MVKFKDFIDTTFREGQQSPLLYDARKYYFTLEEKKELLRGLVNLGISYFEFFSPNVNLREKKHFFQIKKYLRSISKRKIFLLSHCRCKQEDIEASIKAGFDGLNIYMRVTERGEKIYRKSKKEILHTIVDTITTIRRKYPRIYLRFSIEDAFRTPLNEIFEVYDQIYPLVNTFGVPDTTGIATPSDVERLIRKLKKRYPKVNLEVHFHNDRGLALINTMVAIQNGAEFADVSIWGIGERSGIASLTGMLLNLFYLDKNLVKKYNIKLCYPVNVLMGAILKTQVPYNEPVSLTNRTHIAGVHQNAILKEKSNYETHSLEEFGVTKNQLLLGPLSGWHFVYYYLKEVKNYLISEEEAKEITKEFKNKIQRSKENLDDLLEKIAEKHSLEKISIPKEFAKKRVEKLNGTNHIGKVGVIKR